MELSQQDPLRRYLPFKWFIGLQRRINWDLPAINASLVLAIALGCLITSVFEQTIFFRGRANGFIESVDFHLFVAAAIAIPYILRRSLLTAERISSGSVEFISARKLRKVLIDYKESIYEALDRTSFLGRRSYRILVFCGFLVFGWNSIQNQAPEQFVGFIGWDTISYPSSYIATRIFRFYIWFLLAPTILHIQLNLTYSLRILLMSASKKGAVNLKPFHVDQCGGARVFIDSVINPMVPIIVSAGLLTASTFIVHGQLDFTTMGGLGMTSALFLITYLIPATALRRVIKMEKRRKIEEIGEAQHKLMSEVLKRIQSGPLDNDALRSIDHLSELRNQFRRIPNWPQLHFVLKLLGVAISPSIINVARFIVSFAAGVLSSGK